jgi:hypothetical protein
LPGAFFSWQCGNVAILAVVRCHESKDTNLGVQGRQRRTKSANRWRAALKLGVREIANPMEMTYLLPSKRLRAAVDATPSRFPTLPADHSLSSFLASGVPASSSAQTARNSRASSGE